jgi:hypothetical protein
VLACRAQHGNQRIDSLVPQHPRQFSGHTFSVARADSQGPSLGHVPIVPANDAAKSLTIDQTPPAAIRIMIALKIEFRHFH